MKLSDYLNQFSVSPETFAAKIEASVVTVYRYLNRARIPEPGMMVAIFVNTEGLVTPNDFYELPEPTISKKQNSSGKSTLITGKNSHGKAPRASLVL